MILPLPLAYDGDAFLQGIANHVCEHLPEGWTISMHLEKGYGGVMLFDPKGTEVIPGDADGETTLAEQIAACLNAAHEWAASDA